MTDLFTIDSEALPACKVLGFRGHEAISQPFAFEVAILLEGEHVALDLGALIGARATLRLHPSEAPLLFTGVVTSAELLRAWEDKAVCRLVLGPRLARLGLGRHSRVFVGKSVPSIVTELFGAAGVPFESRLTARYPDRDHVCQYEESDLAFVRRLLEAEGIAFWFEHAAEEESMVLSDSASYGQPLRGPVPYRPGSLGDAGSTGDAFDGFLCRHIDLPTEVTLRDYNAQNPTQATFASAPVFGSGAAALRLYGGGAMHLSGGARAFDLERLAKVRAEEQRAGQQRFFGAGGCYGLQSGHRFALEGHPRADFNDAEYLAVEVTHVGNQAVDDVAMTALLGLTTDEYRVEVTAIGSGVTFRPPRVTPVPRIDGAVVAHVDGPADSEYAQLDEHGRYRVKVHFDEVEAAPGGASMWVPMLQPHGGGTEGQHFPLRKGTEVALLFLGGDPDRPIIAGASPNPQKPSPVTSHNHTQNVLVTGGKNQLVFEDDDGAQFVDLATPTEDTFLHLGHPAGGGAVRGARDAHVHLHTDGDHHIDIGGDQDMEVAGNRTVEITGANDVTVHDEMTQTIDKDYTITVGGDTTWTVAGDYTETVSGTVTRQIEEDAALVVTGATTETFVGAMNENFIGVLNSNALSATNENYFGAVVSNFVGATVENYFGTLSSTFVGASVSTYVGNSSALFVGNQGEVNVGNFTSLVVGNETNLNVSSVTNLALSNALDLAIAGQTTIVTALDTTLALGGTLELFGGVAIALKLALDVTIGMGIKVDLWQGTVVEQDAAGKIEVNSYDIHT